MEGNIKAIKIHDGDNVATLFGTARAGMTVIVLDKKGNTAEVTVRDDIPYGHKIAISPLDPGEQVMKYGEAIGITTTSIAVGEHVHVQNIDSIRGRGDWEKK